MCVRRGERERGKKACTRAHIHTEILQPEVLIGCCYRPPSAPMAYWEDIQYSLELIQSKTKSQHLPLLGDFNVDMRSSHSPQNNHLDNRMHQYDLINHVQSPTWVTMTIDLVLFQTTTAELLRDCSVIPVDVSDHSVVLVSYMTYVPVASNMDVNSHQDEISLALTTISSAPV